MSRPRTERRSAWPAVVAAGFLLLPGLYLASLGPVAARPPDWDLFERVYAPICYGVGVCPPLGVPLRWYSEVCDRDGRWLAFDVSGQLIEISDGRFAPVDDLPLEPLYPQNRLRYPR